MNTAVETWRQLLQVLEQAVVCAAYIAQWQVVAPALVGLVDHRSKEVRRPWVLVTIVCDGMPQL